MSQADPDPEQLRLQIHHYLKTLFDIDDTSGIELFIMLQRVARLSRVLDAQLSDDVELSGQRWRLLLLLLIEETRGNTAGLNPTVLSRSQRVSKNTVSALLRGLEAQGLIQRAIDSSDLRAFRIQLTPAGREYLYTTTPRRLESLNRLLSALDPQEQAQLTRLLEKLQLSLLDEYQHTEHELDPVP